MTDNGTDILQVLGIVSFHTCQIIMKGFKHDTKTERKRNAIL